MSVPISRVFKAARCNMRSAVARSDKGDLTTLLSVVVLLEVFRGFPSAPSGQWEAPGPTCTY